MFASLLSLAKVCDIIWLLTERRTLQLAIFEPTECMFDTTVVRVGPFVGLTYDAYTENGDPLLTQPVVSIQSIQLRLISALSQRPTNTIKYKT